MKWLIAFILVTTFMIVNADAAFVKAGPTDSIGYESASMTTAERQ